MTPTALYQRISSGNARTGQYSGAETVLDFGHPQSELDSLRTACGLLDLNWRARITAGGKDRTRWLNGMITNNIRDLQVNRGNYNFVLNPQGRILADLYVYNRGEYLLLDTDRSQLETVMNTLKRFIIMDKVELTESSDALTAIATCGPQAEKVLAGAGLDPSGLEPLELRDLTIQNIDVTLVRGPEQKPGWYELWSSPANTERLWDMLTKAGAQPAGAEALETWRILRGIPRYGVDIRERDLPQETGQQQMLNFTKGCYIGQEIVERIRSRGQVHRKFTGFEFHGALPAPGKIEADGKVVAEITSVTQVGEREIGLGYVRRENAPAGSEIDLNGVKATVLDPPFEFE